MEFVEIIESAKEFIRLRYYPERNTATGEYGEVTYYPEEDDWQFDKLATGYDSGYALHAVNFVRKSTAELKSGIMAWY